MKTKILGLLAVGLLAGPMVSLATAVSYGSLSSNDDGSTQIINDSLNNLQWLRWNGPQLGLTHAQTVAAVGPGGPLDGWSIAHNAQAQAVSRITLHSANPDELPRRDGAQSAAGSGNWNVRMGGER